MKLDKQYVKSISVVGGVSNNKYIKNKIENFFINKNIEIYYPLKEMMTDNAAMIAWACYKNYNINKQDIYFKPQPKMLVNNNLLLICQYYLVLK